MNNVAVSVFLLLSSGAIVCESDRVQAADAPLGDNPACVFRVKKSAIDSAILGTAQLFPKYIPKIPIPAFSLPVDSVKFDFYGGKIEKFGQPEVTYDLVPNNKIAGTLKLTDFALKTAYNATQTVWGAAPQLDSGSIQFHSEGLKIDFNLELGEFENGVPKINEFKCTAKLGQSGVDLQSEAKFVKNHVTMGKRLIRPAVENSLCSIIEHVVDSQVNRLLGKIPNVIPINKNLAIKYLLRLMVNQDNMETQMFGKTLTSQLSPHLPQPFQEAPSDNADVVLLCSDAILNDLLYQSYQNKLFDLTVNKKTPALSKFLSLDCPDANHDGPLEGLKEQVTLLKESVKQRVCLGTHAPTLVTKYGKDGEVQVAFSLTDVPQLQFIEDKATFQGGGRVVLSAKKADSDELKDEVTAKLGLSGSLRLKIHNGAVFGMVTLDDPQVEITSDDPDVTKYQDTLKDTIKQVVQTHINGDLLLKGCPLHLPYSKFQLADPLIKFAPNTLQVQFAVKYKPQTSSEQASGPGSAEANDNPFLTGEASGETAANPPTPTEEAPADPPSHAGSGSGSNEAPHKGSGSGSNEGHAKKKGSGSGGD